MELGQSEKLAQSTIIVASGLKSFFRKRNFLAFKNWEA
jgi:hypothetical protein